MISSRHKLLCVLLGISLLGVAGWLWQKERSRFVSPSVSEQEAGFDELEMTDPEPLAFVHPRLRGLDTWQRPAGPYRVALQVGHWQAASAPDEQENLRVSTGASWRGLAEWEVALAIAEETKKKLEASGVLVEILPVTIPPNYWADAFISIHTDGNLNSAVSGYKVAAPRRDHTGKAEELARVIAETYEDATRLSPDPNITRTMRGYYAFNWRRYEHSIHPMTVAAIIETGFLTNANDRRIIVNAPERSARGIANGILKYLDITVETAQDANSDVVL